MTVLITLTTAGTDTGPFNLYSDINGYSVAFETGVSKSALIAGYSSSLVPNGTTIIRVMSAGLCTNYIDLSIITTTTTTSSTSSTTSTTSTTSSTSTTSTTTTLASVLYYSTASTIDACGGNAILTTVVFTGTPGLCNATAIQGDQFVSEIAGATVWVSDGVNVREAIIDSPNVSGIATFIGVCDSCVSPSTTTTTTTLEPVICDELYNNTPSDITGVDYIDCNGTILTNQTVGSGQSICAQQGTVSGGGFLTNLGNCNV
jgi:hypothetical protein